MSNNPVFTCIGSTKINQNRRDEAEKIAIDLKYGLDIILAIESATTEAELNRALATGRNRMK